MSYLAPSPADFTIAWRARVLFVQDTKVRSSEKALSKNHTHNGAHTFPSKERRKTCRPFSPFSFQSSFSGERQNVSCCSVIRLPTDRALLLATIRHGWIGEGRGRRGGGGATLFISTWPETHTTSEGRKESGAQVSHIFHSSFL